MPLVVLCGQPSSAKSTVASAIEQHLRSQGHAAILISEDTLHQERNVAYKGARAEMLRLTVQAYHSTFPMPFCQVL